MSKPSQKDIQQCIDAAGRLSAYLELTQADVLDLMATVNVGLVNDTDVAAVAWQQLMGDPGPQGRAP